MKNWLHTRSIVLAVAVGAVGVGAARADEADVARGIAVAIIRQGAVAYLADGKLELEEQEFSGTVEAVEPAKHVEVEIQDFLYVPGRVAVTYDIEGRFRFAGKVTSGDTHLDVAGIADVRSRVDLEARYRQEGDVFVVDAKILDMDKFKVAIVELTSDCAPADKELVEKLAKAAINAHSDELIREINEWLAKHQRY